MPIDGPGNPLDDADQSPRQPSFGNAQTVGMILFLMALAVLFVSGLIGFVWIRMGNNTPIHLPVELWLSTALVVGVSIALTVAAKQIKLGRQRAFRNSMTASLALALGFLTVQAPALLELLRNHQSLKATGLHLYGLIFFLILLHAMHVVGGMVAMILVTVKAHRGLYDRPSPDAIRNTTLYWHFLDCVWIVMFAVLFVMQ